MSLKEQPHRPQEPIKYGDVFSSVEGELAQKTVAPRDSTTMQTVENAMLGQVQKGAAASVENEMGCFVGQGDTTALTPGKKPVVAIQSSEIRAAGRINITPGGVAAAAATTNSRATRDDEDKRKLADILTDVMGKLPSDKQVIGRDAEGVVAAEMRNDPMRTLPCGGVC